MKTTLLASAFATALLGLAAAEKPPACCPPLPAEKPPCCVDVKPAAPFSARSLYQLDATWTNDVGQTVSLATLRGRPVVLAMFFAQCEYACPVIVNDIKRLRDALPAELHDRVQLVLVTFDTKRDTPAALRTFRTRMSLDQQWTLLRGEAESVAELAMLLGVKFKEDARGQFAHSNVLTVLSGEGEIVHQLAGLNGDVSDTARVLARLTPASVATR